jgi:hypothetical protein
LTGSRFTSVLLFAGAIVSILFRPETARFGPGFETVAVARSIAEHGQFANPYSSFATGPTAHVAPLYPAFLSLLVWLFGYSENFSVVASALSVLVHGINTALLPRVSKVFFGDARPGLWGGLLTIALPLYFFFPQFEVIYFSAALMLFCLVSHRMALRGGEWPGLLTGSIFGVVSMLNPASATVAIPWMAYASWRFLKNRRARFAVFAVLGFAIALTPWTWRNYQQFHKVFFVRDNLGLELYVSNNPWARETFQQNNASGLYARLHPDPSIAEARECARLGEIEYNRQRMAAALAWMHGQPVEFLELSAARARMFWFPAAEGYPGYAFSIGVVTIASFAGLVLLGLRRRPIVLFLVGVQILYPALYYLVQNDPRFRAPILWISILGAGYLLTSLSRFARKPRQAPQPLGS